MENIKFLSIKFQEKELKAKIQKYKVLVCIVWFACITLFLSLMYFNNLNKEFEKSINLKKSKVRESKEESLIKRVETINNFIEFYTSSSYNTAFNSITVNNNEITVNALVEDKNMLNDIVFNVEHANKYNIIYLSPLSAYNNKYSFKMTIEVKR